MSDIPQARSILEAALNHIPSPPAPIARLIRQALGLMTREAPVRKVRGVPTNMTPELKKSILALAHTGLSEHQIANKVGVRNSGRISEVLHPPKQRAQRNGKKKRK